MAKPADPWEQYRKRTGEFRRWLHVWRYTDSFAIRDGRMMRYLWAPLPWVLPAEQPLNGESLIAMYNLGVTARWPAEWPRFCPPSDAMLPVYGMVTNTNHDIPLLKHLSAVEAQCLTHKDFMKKMDRYILFNTQQESSNANSRSAKDRRSFI